MNGRDPHDAVIPGELQLVGQGARGIGKGRHLLTLREVCTDSAMEKTIKVCIRYWNRSHIPMGDPPQTCLNAPLATTAGDDKSARRGRTFANQPDPRHGRSVDAPPRRPCLCCNATTPHHSDRPNWPSRTRIPQRVCHELADPMQTPDVARDRRRGGRFRGLVEWLRSGRLHASGRRADTGASPRGGRPAAAGAARVGTLRSPSRPPVPTNSSSRCTQDMTGVNPDIARLIANALGLNIEIAVTNFDSIIPGLAADRTTYLRLLPLTPTAERMQQLDFVDYVQMGSALVVPTGNPNGVTFDALCGKPSRAAQGLVPVGGQRPDDQRDLLRGRPAVIGDLSVSGHHPGRGFHAQRPDRLSSAPTRPSSATRRGRTPGSRYPPRTTSPRSRSARPRATRPCRRWPPPWSTSSPPPSTARCWTTTAWTRWPSPMPGSTSNNRGRTRA